MDDLVVGTPRSHMWQGDRPLGNDRRLPAARVQTGDGGVAEQTGALSESAFVDRAGQYHRELHVHCYRMLASFDEAEDALQETLLRAWRGRATLQGPKGLRPWLYRIATNVCLDALRDRKRRVSSLPSLAEVAWLQPYPDRLLDEAAPSGAEPEAALVARETIELTFLAIIQLLPPRQRAALILCDVLDWPARDVASLLSTSAAAVNSALQRARTTMRGHRPERRSDRTPSQPSAGQPSAAELELLGRYMAAHERGWDLPELVAQDVRLTMPPLPHCYRGWPALRPLTEIANGMGDWRLIPTSANRLPAAACYLRRRGEAAFHAHKLDVLRIENGVIAEFTTFGVGLFGPAAFSGFDLPTTLEVIGK